MQKCPNANSSFYNATYARVKTFYAIRAQCRLRLNLFAFFVSSPFLGCDFSQTPRDDETLRVTITRETYWGKNWRYTKIHTRTCSKIVQGPFRSQSDRRQVIRKRLKTNQGRYRPSVMTTISGYAVEPIRVHDGKIYRQNIGCNVLFSIQ